MQPRKLTGSRDVSDERPDEGTGGPKRTSRALRSPRGHSFDRRRPRMLVAPHLPSAVGTKTWFPESVKCPVIHRRAAAAGRIAREKPEKECHEITEHRFFRMGSGAVARPGQGERANGAIGAGGSPHQRQAQQPFRRVRLDDRHRPPTRLAIHFKSTRATAEGKEILNVPFS
jgi:hypothetical protein